MSAQHTPGPWRRDKYGNVVDANGEEVLFRSIGICASGSGERVARAERNTDLAVAAPDLLRVAELLVDWLDEEEGAHKLCDAARAAIAKAAGGAA